MRPQAHYRLNAVRHTSRADYVTENLIICLFFWVHADKRLNLVMMNVFAGGPMGVGTIKDWGSDWSEYARLVFRLHADWADFPTPRPWVEP